MKQIVFLTHIGISKQNIDREFKKHETIVLIPGEDVILTTVSLPKLNEKRLMQALPFALEEKLITEPSELHFAIGPNTLHQHLPVAIIAKKKMQYFLDLLAKEEITPTVLIPEMYALPVASGQWYALLHEQTMSVRTGPWSGFTCDRENITTYLQSELSNVTEKVETLHIYNISEKPFDSPIRDIVINEIQTNTSKLLGDIHSWENEPKINLLQGSFQSKHTFGSTKKIWIASSLCLSIVFFLALMSQIISITILKQGVSETNSAIYAIYKKHYPNASSLVAPRERLEAKLKAQSRDTLKNNFLVTLSEIGKYLILAKDLQLESIDYHQNQYYLTLKTNRFENLDHFQKNLKAAHFEVRQQNAELADSQIKANLIITRGQT